MPRRVPRGPAIGRLIRPYTDPSSIEHQTAPIDTQYDHTSIGEEQRNDEQSAESDQYDSELDNEDGIVYHSYHTYH